MSRIASIAVGVLLFTSFGSRIALADDQVIVPTLTGKTLLSTIQAAGFQAELTFDDGGDPLIKTNFSDWPVWLYFYNCDKSPEKACNSFQMVAAYGTKIKPKIDLINKWNSENRFGTASLDKDGSPWLRMDYVSTGGFVAKNAQTAMSVFGRSVSQFKDAIIAGDKQP